MLKKTEMLISKFKEFREELNKMYLAENQIANALPYLIRESSSSKLKKALQLHLQETKIQIKRLEEIASEFNEKFKSGENFTIKAILQDGKRSLLNCDDASTKDASIIMHIQKIKHYEMACYGSLQAFARHFKLNHILTLLEESGREEGYLDKALTKIAEGSFFSSGINTKSRKKCA